MSGCDLKVLKQFSLLSVMTALTEKMSNVGCFKARVEFKCGTVFYWHIYRVLTREIVDVLVRPANLPSNFDIRNAF